MDVGLLNEAVICVWGWRAGCPAASWASLCCGGLIEPTEEAHFRVIYYHPNTSCLLCGRCRPALPAPSWGTSSPSAALGAPSPFFKHQALVTFMYVCIYSYYRFVYVYKYIWVCRQIRNILSWVCFLIGGWGLRQGESCQAGSSVPQELGDLGRVT